MTAVIEFGREVCGNLEAAESREWLVTNGIGGYASGTIVGGMTRRYHGLLIAALRPPVGRMHLVAALDEFVRCGGEEFALATHLWASGAVEPTGFQHIEGFLLDGTTPVWTYAFSNARLEKRVWMQQGMNTTYVQYTLLKGSAAIEMELKALVNYRDFHGSTHAGDWKMHIDPVEHGIRVVAFDEAAPFSLFRAKLSAGESVTIVSTTEENATFDSEMVRAQRAAREAEIAAAWRMQNKATSAASPEWLQQLVLAADQFIVKRAIPDEPDGRSVIAGYHWFGDWGRDTMIALPGLTLTTGRPEVARQILLAFAKYVDAGMLPNNFPDAGGKPEYNSVDAALWYFEAVRQYFAATRDVQTLQTLFPALARMIDAHVKGTRYQIHVDPSDGLLYAGEPDVQVTWMDAKIGDWVVTPRTGKAVEINALWINALETMMQFAQVLKISSDGYQIVSSQAKTGFQRFWNAERKCCYDVIDAPGLGNDALLRPNQILAVSLPVSPLRLEQQKAVVDVCAAQLLTPYGLRSLAPGEAGYQGCYSGGPRERDGAYHQGTVWVWLLGPFVLAHHRVYADGVAAMRFLEPLGAAIQRYGLGTLGEIFDGDAPFAPKGCIAQAWSVGEVLRAWVELAHEPNSAGSRPKRAPEKSVAPA